MGDILPIVATPLVLSFVPGITLSESPAETLVARIGFCKTLLAPKRLPTVPFAEFTAWVGATAYMPPRCGALAIERKQDPRRLKEEGVNGLPLCIISGKADLQVLGEKVVEQMQPYFKDCEVHFLEEAGHILFWEEPKTVGDIILNFVRRMSQT